MPTIREHAQAIRALERLGDDKCQQIRISDRRPHCVQVFFGVEGYFLEIFAGYEDNAAADLATALVKAVGSKHKKNASRHTNGGDEWWEVP